MKFKLVRISIWVACFNFLKLKQYLLFIKLLEAVDAAENWIKSRKN